MQGFFDSFREILAKYKVEIILILLAVVATVISVGIFISNGKNTLKTSHIPLNQDIKTVKSVEEKIVVDLSGSVQRTGTYEISNGARLKEVLTMAGGLSPNADQEFFSKNFNLARRLVDQEKIYIPSIDDIDKGSMNLPKTSYIISTGQTLGASNKLNINTATMEQLDGITGLGKTTAQKIITNRPYGSLDELVSKKVMYQSLLNKIKDSIEF